MTTATMTSPLTQSYSFGNERIIGVQGVYHLENGFQYDSSIAQRTYRSLTGAVEALLAVTDLEMFCMRQNGLVSQSTGDRLSQTREACLEFLASM